MTTKSIRLTLTLLLWLLFSYAKADVPYHVSRLITVREGLPQSYISSVFQDKQGFLWVSTLNGLGRYDGRQFKNYQHTAGDATGISDNIILNLVDAGDDELLLCYMDGRIDMFNTVNEKVIHLWKTPAFNVLKKESANFKSIVCNKKGKCWMLSGDDGVYEIDLAAGKIRRFLIPGSSFHEAVIGMTLANDKLLLLTNRELFSYDIVTGVTGQASLPFGGIIRFERQTRNGYSIVARKNGDLIIADAAGIRVWNPKGRDFISIQLKRTHVPGIATGQLDSAGSYFFECDSAVYRLSPDNSLVKLLPPNRNTKEIPTNIYVDRSGVLWIGTNGFGLWQHTFSKTGLPGYQSRLSFARDVLISKGYPEKDINKTLLAASVSYANRNVLINDSIWIIDIYRPDPEPKLALCTRNGVTEKIFKSADTRIAGQPRNIRFITSGIHGTLWGIDNYYRPVKFDKEKLTFRTYGAAAIEAGEDLTGMVTDDGINFYISTNKSFCSFNILTGKTQTLTAILPGREILHICNDPVNRNLIWVGTLSDGLIRFDKANNSSRLYNMASGLPNNTIYSILPGKDGLFWCSSNKGIFAFDPGSKDIRSFTSRDGLTDDEFNRFYYMTLPGGELAFGGPIGYTIFDPLKLENDVFEPQIVLTDLNIINTNYRSEVVNDVQELHLRYDQNFITAIFAATQFDFPEKLRYRYMLEGLDKDWIMLGNDNKASYTSLPPGDYVLKLNATNTAGKWSHNVKEIRIVIAPPFWKTWWFFLISGAAVMLLLYSFLQMRISSIRKAQRQELLFERKAMELHALALRAQMNPHFIFNSLNSIKALIQEKHNREAVTYLTTFSILIRKQLNNKSNEVSLQEELETCKLYLQLEAMRFDGRISFRFDIDTDEELLQVPVPPLILQPVIENAIIHGLLPSEHGGQVTVKVYRENDHCVCEIADNGIGRTASQTNKEKSSRLHQSQGMQLLAERINLHNRLSTAVSSLETIDLFTSEGQPSGTLVILKFNLHL